MFSGADRKKERVRTAILQEVYQENLRIIGKKEEPFRFVRTSPFSRRIFFLLLFLLALIGNVHYLGPAIPEITHRGDNGFQNSLLKTTSGSLATPELSAVTEYSSFLTESSVPISEIFDLKVRTIVIDPGHGGEDSGAMGAKGIKEKDITLDIAKRLRARLGKYSNYQIFMTREDDSTVPLNKRIEYANAHKADIYISIHVNYVLHKPINIIETYYFGHYEDIGTLRLAEMENKGSQYSLGDFKTIVQKIGNTIKLQESRDLAASIQRSLYKNISEQNSQILDFGTKTAPFVVLLGVDVPSVLTEVSCLSNKAEEEKLGTEEYREEVARFLEEGILDYLNNRIKKGDIIYETNRTD